MNPDDRCTPHVGDPDAERRERNGRVADAVGMLVAPLGYLVVPKRSREAALEAAWAALTNGRPDVADGFVRLARELCG